MYGDVEALVIAWLGEVSQLNGVAVKMPESPALPFALVTRTSGADDYVTDRAVVDVEVFAADRTSSYNVAAIVHAAMLTLRGKTAAGMRADYVDVITGPAWMDYGDELLQRHLMSYRIESRAPRP